MRYKLNGACQRGSIGWKWIDPGDEKVIIPYGDILTDVHKNAYEERHAKIKKFLMNLAGYKYFYSAINQRVIVVHDSIIERYFDKIKE